MTLTVETLAALLRANPHLVWFGDDGATHAAEWLLPQLGAGAPAPVVKIAPGVPPEDEAGHTLDDHIGALETLAAPGHRETARQLADSALRLYAVLLRAARVGATERVERSADAPEGPWRAHKAAIEDWWEVERDGGAEYFGPRLFATKVEAIAVRDALNRVASQREKPHE